MEDNLVIVRWFGTSIFIVYMINNFIFLLTTPDHYIIEILKWAFTLSLGAVLFYSYYYKSNKIKVWLFLCIHLRVMMSVA